MKLLRKESELSILNGRIYSCVWKEKEGREEGKKKRRKDEGQTSKRVLWTWGPFRVFLSHPKQISSALDPLLVQLGKKRIKDNNNNFHTELLQGLMRKHL